MRYLDALIQSFEAFQARARDRAPALGRDDDGPDDAWYRCQDEIDRLRKLQAEREAA